jgi:hypothetical protein
MRELKELAISAVEKQIVLRLSEALMRAAH